MIKFHERAIAMVVDVSGKLLVYDEITSPTGKVLRKEPRKFPVFQSDGCVTAEADFLRDEALQLFQIPKAPAAGG